MIVISTYLIATVCILLWTDWIETIPIKYIKDVRQWLDYKPFNCSLCLSFWLGVVISIITLNPIYIGLPLFVKVIEVNI